MHAIPLGRASSLLRSFILARGQSQAAAARESGYSAADLSRLLNGKRKVDLYEVDLISERMRLARHQRIKLLLNHTVDWVSSIRTPRSRRSIEECLQSALQRIVGDLDWTDSERCLDRLSQLAPCLADRGRRPGTWGIWLTLVGYALWQHHPRLALKLWDAACELLSTNLEEATDLEVVWSGNAAVSIADEVARRGDLSRAEQAFEFAESKATQSYQLHHINLSRAEVRLERMGVGRLPLDEALIDDARRSLTTAEDLEATMHNPHPAEAAQRAANQAFCDALQGLLTDIRVDAEAAYGRLHKVLADAEPVAERTRDTRWKEAMSLMWLYRACLARRLELPDDEANALAELDSTQGDWPAPDAHRADLIRELQSFSPPDETPWVLAAK